jgi:hypothetical protein
MLQLVDTHQAAEDAQRDNETDIGVSKSGLSSNKLPPVGRKILLLGQLLL